MTSTAQHANRLRRRKGVSMSGLRRIENIVAHGPRSVRRQFVAADRRALGTGGRHHE